MQPKLRPLLIFILSILLTCPVYGDGDEEKPSLDFLLFLGIFEDANGKWQDPMEIDRMLEHNNETEHDEKNQQEESSDE